MTDIQNKLNSLLDTTGTYKVGDAGECKTPATLAHNTMYVDGSPVGEQRTLADAVRDAMVKADNGPWIPACGGKEVPFKTRTGRTLWYMWQPSTGRHAYYDVGTDMFLSDDEAMAALGPL